MHPCKSAVTIGANVNLPSQSAPAALDECSIRISSAVSAQMCASAEAAVDPVTKAKFEQEQHQWLLRAEQAEKTERNLMTRPSREGPGRCACRLADCPPIKVLD